MNAAENKKSFEFVEATAAMMLSGVICANNLISDISWSEPRNLGLTQHYLLLLLELHKNSSQDISTSAAALKKTVFLELHNVIMGGDITPFGYAVQCLLHTEHM